MPTRADIEAATPRCPRHGVARVSQLHPSSRLQPNERCFAVLTPARQADAVGRPVHTDWWCSRHGVIHGAELQPIPTTGVAA